MKLPLGNEADEFMELRFKPGSWDKSGIPSQGCRIRKMQLEQALSQGGNFEVDDLIYGLMDWLDVTDDPEPALATLKEMLDRHYPADGRAHARCVFAEEEGGDRIIHIGPIDYSEELVAWQRREWVIAAGQRAEEQGRIIFGASAPVSLAVAQRMLWLGMVNFMCEPFDSFEGALSSARSTASAYSWAAGAATTIAWEHGLGWTIEDGELTQTVDVDYPDNSLWLPPNQLAMQIAIATGYLK